MFGKTNWILKGVRGAHAHAIYVLNESVILGRSAAADIQILDQRVSREHARILVTADEVLLEDLGSHNGTFVHGLKVVRRPLRTGDKVSIGVSEYVIDQLKGRVLTSAIFLNKLTTKDTMGATAVKRRMATEILTSRTQDMPAQRTTQELVAAEAAERPSEQRLERPARPASGGQAPPSPPPNDPPAKASEPEESEPAYLRDQRERAVRLPTPMPGELEWSLHEKADESEPDPRNDETPLEPPAAEPPASRVEPPTARFERPVPRDEPPVSRVEPPISRVKAPAEKPSLDPLAPGMNLTTVPLDPRSQRVHTPIPGSLEPEPLPQQVEPERPKAQPEPPAPASHGTPRNEPADGDDVGHEAALRTLDAVVRLLKLRAKESGGALLKIQDRENLRRLEGVLRESHRNKANRRRWTRLPCQFTASIGEEGAETTAARILDISAGGLRVEGQQGVEPGDLVSIRVRLGEGRLARVAVFQTRVVWVNPDDDTFGALFDGPAQWELAS
ncbi:MAG: FHA domain-containing protein [Nannocystales bacterium]